MENILMHPRLFTRAFATLVVMLSPVLGTPTAAKGFEADPRIRSAGSLTLQTVEHEGRPALQAQAVGGMTGEDRLVHLPGPDFLNGVITGFMSGQPVADATPGARGFVGVAFRTRLTNGAYEAFYVRPANGRSDDQLRRNRSTQYISHPEYTWERLRSEAPGVYESYADMEPGRWIPFRIEVKGSHARLYLGDASQPALIVSDLKRGPQSKGGIALWVGPETLAHFSNIAIVRRD